MTAMLIMRFLVVWVAVDMSSPSLEGGAVKILIDSTRLCARGRCRG